MRIGVISDTHDKVDAAQRALSYFKEHGVELVVHCGDWKSAQYASLFATQAHEAHLPVIGVLGNNDLAIDEFISLSDSSGSTFTLYSGVHEITIDSRHIAIYHGHHKPTLRNLLQNTSYDLLLLGHTHKPLISRSEHTIVVNPGSTAFAIPRSKLWVPTVAIVDTQSLDAEIISLDNN